MTPSQLRTMRKRLISPIGPVAVSDTGTIHNYEIAIQTGELGTEWGAVTDTKAVRAVREADSVRYDGKFVVAKTGLRTLRLPTDNQRGRGADVLKAPVEPTIIDAVNGSRRAFGMLYASLSKDDTLPILSVACITQDDGRTFGLATDRFQLTKAELPSRGPERGDVLLPGRIVRELANHDAWHLAFDDDRAEVRMCGTGVTVRALTFHGEYPKVRSLFGDHTENHVRLTIPVKVTLDLIGSMHLHHLTPIVVHSDGSIGADDVGVYQIPGAHSKIVGDPSSFVGLNYKRLAGLLKPAQADTVTLEWNEKMKPMTVLIDGAVTGLLMPVRSDGTDGFDVESEAAA